MLDGANSVAGIIGMLSKISFILLALLFALSLLRRQSAAKRVLAAQLCLLALILLPFIWQILPSTRVVLPLAWSALTDAPLVIPDLPGLHYFSLSINVDSG